MPKPVCVPCQRFFRPKKNGRYFVEGMPVSNDASPGNINPSAWRPYKLWAGDEWECRGCGATIIVSAGIRPIAEQHEERFAETMNHFNPTVFVNDC